MDILIISHALVTFCIFLFLHSIVNRLIDHIQAPVLIPHVFALSGIVLCIFSTVWYLMGLYGAFTLIEYVVMMSITLILYTCMSFLYILTIFSVVESSITIKLLHEISKTGKHGIVNDDLMKCYGLHSIIKRRLQRFLQMGVVQRKNSTYIVVHKQNIFSIREIIFALFHTVFPLPDNNKKNPE